MADDVTVRLLSGKFDSGAGGLHTEGDTFDVAADTADEHAELEPVSDGESGGSGEENAPTDATETDDLTDLSGVGDTTADKLHAAGYGSFVDLRGADTATVADDVDGLSKSDVEDLQRQLED